MKKTTFRTLIPTLTFAPVPVFTFAFVLVLFAALFICGCSKKQPNLDATSANTTSADVPPDEKNCQLCVSKDGSAEELRQRCVSIDGEEKQYCFNLFAFAGYNHVKVSSQNDEVTVRYETDSSDFSSTIDTKCEFDKTSKKLILKSITSIGHDPNDLDGGVEVCKLAGINKNVDDIDDDRLFEALIEEPNCHYEYARLPPLQKIHERVSKMKDGYSLENYSKDRYVERYKAYLRTYPLTDANYVIYNDIGYYLEQAEAYEAAIYILKAVLEKYPQRAVAHLNIADAYWYYTYVWKEGDNWYNTREWEKAGKHYAEYVRLMKSQKKDMSKIPEWVYDRINDVDTVYGGSGCTPSHGSGGECYEYLTARIGNYVWTTENIRSDYGEHDDGSKCYASDDSNCDKYGRLYKWKVATYACPDGWHLPTVQEWDDLSAAAGGTRSVTVDADQEIVMWKGAGTKLKSKTGWNGNGEGADDYGFSALPGGSRGVDNEFDELGDFGYWWTATEESGNHAYIRRMNRHNSNVDGYTAHKDFMYSVRCVRNYNSPPPPKKTDLASISKTSGKSRNSGDGQKSGTAKIDTLRDSRDGQKYRTVKIGRQRWMAENLNYKTPKGSFCYNNNADCCKKYGRLYFLDAAKSACPAGWHLPSGQEWDSLATAAGGEMAGKRLKARNGWYWDEEMASSGAGHSIGEPRWYRNPNGTDSYGFSALSGGYASPGASGGKSSDSDLDGAFMEVGSNGIWWTATGQDNRYMDFYSEEVRSGNNDEDSYAFSVRCVQN